MSDQEIGHDETIMMRWRAMLRRRIVDVRQRMALALWTSDGRRPPIDVAGPDGDEYDVTVRYVEGSVVRLRGRCHRSRTWRLTGFMGVFEDPFAQILAVDDARLDVDTTNGPLIGVKDDPRCGVGVSVLTRSTMHLVHDELEVKPAWRPRSA